MHEATVILWPHGDGGGDAAMGLEKLELPEAGRGSKDLREQGLPPPLIEETSEHCPPGP